MQPRNTLPPKSPTKDAPTTAPAIITGPRATALSLLDEILRKNTPLSEAFEQSTGWKTLPPSDAGLTRLLVLTVLRRLSQLDALINRYLDEPETLPGKARDALRLGAAQLFFLKTPAHAAVSETVAILPPPLKGVVNAVLRRLSNDGETHFKTQDEARLALPLWLWNRWVKNYGEETTRAITRITLQEPPLDLTPMIDAASLAQSTGGTLLGTGSVRLRDSQNPTQLAGFNEGAFVVQDFAAALPARWLGDINGKNIIDLCAAPGGKTAQLLAAGAKVWAVDNDPARIETLKRNLARLKKSATLISADAARWIPQAPVDAILLDAPCTATGTLRRHPDLAHRKSEANLQKQTVVQKTILRHLGKHAARFLKPGGILLYVVCSLEPEEGETQIEAFLKDHPAFRRHRADDEATLRLKAALPGGAITPLGDLRTLPHFEPPSRSSGAPTATPSSTTEPTKDNAGMDGFFAARLVYGEGRG